MVAADFLTEQGKELSRAAADREMELGRWQKKLEADEEAHRNKMRRVQSEIAELEAKSKALAENLAQQTAAFEDLTRKTAEEKKELERLRGQQEELKAGIRDAAIKEANAFAERRAQELQSVMTAFRDATLPAAKGNEDPFVSLHLEFGKLGAVHALSLCKAFADIPDEGVKVRIDIQKHPFEKAPEERLFSAYEEASRSWMIDREGRTNHCWSVREKLGAPEYRAVLWIEGKREAVANFVRAKGPLQDRLTQGFSFSDITLHPVDLPKYVKINEATHGMWFGIMAPHVPDSLAREVRGYTPFSDNVIAAHLSP